MLCQMYLGPQFFNNIRVNAIRFDPLIVERNLEASNTFVVLKYYIVAFCREGLYSLQYESLLVYPKPFKVYNSTISDVPRPCFAPGLAGSHQFTYVLEVGIEICGY